MGHPSDNTPDTDDEAPEAVPCPWCETESQEIDTTNETNDGETLWMGRVECACGVCGPWSDGFIDQDDAVSAAVIDWNEFAE